MQLSPSETAPLITVPRQLIQAVCYLLQTKKNGKERQNGVSICLCWLVGGDELSLSIFIEADIKGTVSRGFFMNHLPPML
jgi:hypothetical protein